MTYRILVICIIFLAASAFIAHASRSEIVPIRESLSNIPMRIGSWQGLEAGDFDARILDKLGVDDYINRVYFNSGQFPAGLYIGYYQSQKAGDTIHSPLNCLPGAGWNPVKNDRINIQVSENSLIRINRIIILKGNEKQLVLYWYQSHGRTIASEYWGKIYTVLDAVRMNRTDAAMVRIVCPLASLDPEAEAAAEQNAVEFVKKLYPLLGRYLPS